MKAWRVAAALAAGVSCGPGRPPYVIDRVEGPRAVLVSESGEVLNAALEELPAGAREGDAVVDGRLDERARVRLERAAEALRRRLSQDDRGGDLSLVAP